MTLVPVGGLRARFLLHSFRLTIEDIIIQANLDQQVTLLPGPVDWDESVDYNTVALAVGNLPENQPAEIGSPLATRLWTFYVDGFFENESVALHVMSDIRDALGGSYPAIGYTNPIIDILDFSQATPPSIGTFHITSVVSDNPPPIAGKPWTKHYYVLIVEGEDTYSGFETS